MCKIVTISHHQEIKPGTLKSILKQMAVPEDQFKAL